MKCPKHGIKMVQLFSSWACDVCDPPKGSISKAIDDHLTKEYVDNVALELTRAIERDLFCDWPPGTPLYLSSEPGVLTAICPINGEMKRVGTVIGYELNGGIFLATP